MKLKHPETWLVAAEIDQLSEEDRGLWLIQVRAFARWRLEGAEPDGKSKVVIAAVLCVPDAPPRSSLDRRTVH